MIYRIFKNQFIAYFVFFLILPARLWRVDPTNPACPPLEGQSCPKKTLYKQRLRTYKRQAGTKNFVFLATLWRIVIQRAQRKKGAEIVCLGLLPGVLPALRFDQPIEVSYPNWKISFI